MTNLALAAARRNQASYDRRKGKKIGAVREGPPRFCDLPVWFSRGPAGLHSECSVAEGQRMSSVYGGQYLMSSLNTDGLIAKRVAKMPYGLIGLGAANSCQRTQRRCHRTKARTG